MLWGQQTGQSSIPSATVMRAVVEAFHRDPLAVLEFAHREVELWLRLDPSGDAKSRRFRGHAEILEAISTVFAAFDDLSMDVVDVVELGSGFMLATVRHRARGRMSGALCSSELFHVATVRDGLITLWEVFLEEQAAVSAATGRRGVNGRVTEPGVAPA